MPWKAIEGLERQYNPSPGRSAVRLTYGNTTEQGLEAQKVVFWCPGNAVSICSNQSLINSPRLKKNSFDFPKTPFET